jgi:hypothetical protein
MSFRNPVDLVRYAAERLGTLREKLTFLGGAVVPLLVSERGTRAPRVTIDVDLCRFNHGPVVIGVMPADPA